MGQALYAYAYIARPYARQQLGNVWDTFHPIGILTSDLGFKPWAEWSKPVFHRLYDLSRMKLLVLRLGEDGGHALEGYSCMKDEWLTDIRDSDY